MLEFCLMKISKLFLSASLLLGIIFLFSGPLSTQAIAATPCVGLDPPPGGYIDLGDYFTCAIPRAFSVFRTILVAIAIIFTLLLIYRMLTNTTNSKIMEEIPTRWLYLLIFIVLIVGGGSALNIILKFFGFGGVDPWLKIISDLIDSL